MRTAVALVLLLPAAAPAQSGAYLAVVGPETQLRAGPSSRYPEVGVLPPGTRVLVEHEEPGGWLAVQAPPGSLSWVPVQFLQFDKSKPLPQNAMAEGDITLAVGRVGLAQPVADVEVKRVKVPAGTLLTVIGEKVLHDGRSWYPVTPPFGDYRYIPKAAAQPEQAANTSFSVRTNDRATPAGGTTPGGAAPAGGIVAAIPAAKPVTDNPLWAQAEAAEREGRYDEAEKLYFQVASAVNEGGGDHDLANRCYSRIHGLREKKRGTSPPPAASAPPVRRDERASMPPPTRETGTLPPSAKEATRPAGGTTATGGKADWQKPAVLTRAAIAPGGKKTYALESSPGVVVMYVQAGDGIDAERYVKRRVAVYGTPASVPRLSRPLVVAQAIDPAGN